jgi:glycerol-3-phosphate dehydrogenase (NAD(P)+)
MKVTVLGTGRWASFNAWYQSSVLKNEVLVWGIDDKFYQELSRTRTNDYVVLPESVRFTPDLAAALDFADTIIISISSQHMPSLSKEIGATGVKNRRFILCMKGIIDSTGERLSVVLEREIDKSNVVVVWVGPAHPKEVVGSQPNIMVLDGKNKEVVKEIVKKFRSPLLRLYQGDDLIGAEIGAAAKNVLGIVAGILDGAGLSSLKGALMARGIYEVSRLIVALGGKQMTAYGISHLGDFEATLFSKNSHNRLYGEKFFAHQKIDCLAEGVATCKALHLLAAKNHVDMPICRACYEMLYEGKDPTVCLKELFERENADEFRF